MCEGAEVLKLHYPSCFTDQRLEVPRGQITGVVCGRVGVDIPTSAPTLHHNCQNQTSTGELLFVSWLSPLTKLFGPWEQGLAACYSPVQGLVLWVGSVSI